MEPVFDLASVDTDGAIQEAQEAVAGDTRASFFRKAAIGGGTVLTSGAIMGMLPELAAARPSKKQDLKILNYALTLEYLEAAFYKEAVDHSSTFSPDAKAFAAIVADHEATHVQVLRKTIKSLHGHIVRRPNFNFKGTPEDEKKFLATSFVLENTGVHAYLGQAPRLLSRSLLAAAGSILTVEARHSAAAAILVNDKPYRIGKHSITPNGAFDTGLSMKTILGAVGRTGFITG